MKARTTTFVFSLLLTVSLHAFAYQQKVNDAGPHNPLPVASVLKPKDATLPKVTRITTIFDDQT